MAEALSWRRSCPKSELNCVDEFSRNAARLQRLGYRDTEEFRSELNTILDELNSIDFSIRSQSEEDIARVFRICCHLVPLQYDSIVVKLCQFIHSTLNTQQMVLVHDCDVVVEYLLRAFRHGQRSILVHVFRALATVLFENAGRTTKFHEELIGQRGILRQLPEFGEPALRRAVVQCLENICIRSAEHELYISSEHQTLCGQTLLSVLQQPFAVNSTDLTFNKTLISAMKGIQNLLQASKLSFSADLNGPVLAALQVYMFYSLSSGPCMVPESLSTLPLDDANLPAATPKPQTPTERPATSHKSRKQKTRRTKSKSVVETAAEVDDAANEVDAAFSRLGVRDDGSTGFWAALGSSDSEFSDVEHGSSLSVSHLKRNSSARVRLHSLACFHAFIKATDRRVMFGYWPSFIPDNSDMMIGVTGGAQHTLLTVIMKDPSPKVRMAALGVMTALFDGSKQFLMVAEDSDLYRPTSFTPLSVVVGRMVRAVHRCLLMVLSSESSAVVTTQLLKCLATVIANVPYQRLRPGLLGTAVKQIRPFLSHRDPNIRVACLTCLGCVVSTPSPLLEVCQIVEPVRPSHRVSDNSAHLSSSTAESARPNRPLSVGTDRLSPGIVTPVVSGTQTPLTESLNSSFVEGDGGVVPTTTSWLVRLCVRCVTPQLAINADGTRQPLSSSQPLPVRLEALQLLTLLTKGYFMIVRKSLSLVKELIETCLLESDGSIQLHAAKLLDAVGSKLLQDDQQSATSADSNPALNQGAVQLWLGVLSGPLQTALNSNSSQTIRSTICDCLSNVGQNVFVTLPAGVQTLCITLLLGLSTDSDPHVRAAAIRALGCCVLYPSLREDVAFVADTSNVFITAASESMVFVRWRVAWSLGNLSDALVLNRTDSNVEFMGDFSVLLLSKLLQTAIKLCSDSDKTRYNAVRAVGNLLRYLPHQALESGRLDDDVQAGLQAIVKNISSGSVKVRWNACYAMANVFSNEVMHSVMEPHLATIFASLGGTARTSKNFKVRISASTAMAAAKHRSLYGSKDTYLVIWSSLADVLESLEDIDADFAEYKYRDSLVEQVCSTLVHAIALITVDDIQQLTSLLAEKSDILSLHLTKYVLSAAERAEKAAECVNVALSHLKQLILSTDSEQVKVTVNQLCDLLSPAPGDAAAAYTAGISSQFRQMYD